MRTRSELIRFRRQMHRRIRAVVAERRMAVAQLAHRGASTTEIGDEGSGGAEERATGPTDG